MAEHPTKKVAATVRTTKNGARSRRRLYDLEADAIKALAHPKRLLLLDLLSDGEARTVTQLVGETGISQSNVSQNLAIMRAAALVEPRREGHLVYYSVADQRIVRAVTMMRAVMGDRMQDKQFMAERAALHRKQAARKATTYAVSALAGIVVLAALGAGLHPLAEGGSMGDVGRHIGLMATSGDLGTLAEICFEIQTGSGVGPAGMSMGATGGPASLMATSHGG